MSDTAVGFLIVGIGMLLVLGIVYAISSRPRPVTGRIVPPAGVHLPPPSYLPVVLSVAASLLGAGLVFRGEDQFANWFLLVPGLVVFVLGVMWWVGAANREWREVEHGAAHHGAVHATDADHDTQKAHDDHPSH
jgi:hypothetical protein